MIKLLRKFTALIRLLDFRLASNRFAVAASFLVAGAAGGLALLDGKSIKDAAATGFLFGMSVFCAWAVGRELDPDDPRSAAISTVLAAGLLFTGRPAVGAAFGVLFAARIAARTVGQPPTVLDLLALIGFAFYLGRFPEGVPAGLAMGIALVLDGRLPQPSPRHVVAAGVATIAAALAGAILFARGGWEMPAIAEWAIAGVAGGALIGMRIGRPTTEDDRHRPLDRQRLLWALRLASGAAFATFLRVGGPAIPKLAPVWAGLVGVAIGRRLRQETADG